MMFFKSRPKIEAVIFDIGGVLVEADLERYLVYGARVFNCRPEQLQEVAQPFLIQLECGFMTSAMFWESVALELDKRGWGKYVPGRKFDGFWKGLLRDTIKINHPLIDLLPRIQRRASLGALSNTIDEHAEYLEKLGVYKLFRQTVLSFQVGMRKPDPVMYKLIASRLNVPIGKCLLIDDSPINTEGALKAGMRAHEYHSLEDLASDLAMCNLLG